MIFKHGRVVAAAAGAVARGVRRAGAARAGGVRRASRHRSTQIHRAIVLIHLYIPHKWLLFVTSLHLPSITNTEIWGYKSSEWIFN